MQGYVHTYAITSLDPCGVGTFTGVSTDANVFGIQEHITGTLLGGHLKFTATYDNTTYSWNYDGPLLGGTAQDSAGPSFGVTSTFVRAKTWKNHGEYVAAQGGGSDAAHSCIGMPIS